MRVLLVATTRFPRRLIILALPTALPPLEMPDPAPTRTVQDSLPPGISTAYASCLEDERRSLEWLGNAVSDYLGDLRARGSGDAFLDLETAEAVGAGCRRLIDQLEQSRSDAAHAAVQAAVLYFILEDDAEQDDSVIGFDDDLQVVAETFKALGWDDGGTLA